MQRGGERAVVALRAQRDREVRARGLLPAPACTQHEERGVSERARVRARVIRVPAPRPAELGRPLRPEDRRGREIRGDVVEHRFGSGDVFVVADATAMAEQGVRVRDAAHPGNMHVVALVAPVERAGLDQPCGIGLVVPAMQAVGGELGSLLDRHPGRRHQLVRGTERPPPVAVGAADVEDDGLPGLPAVRAHVRRPRRLGAVVAKRFLAVREVEPDRRSTVAIGEPDAGLPERRGLARDEAAAAREHRRRRTAVGAERPRVRLHPLDVDVTGREAGIDARARLAAVLAVEHARDEPLRVVGGREAQRDANACVRRLRARIPDSTAIEHESVDGRSVRRERATDQHSSLPRACRRSHAPRPGRDRARRSR